jgi:hypothetical protein
MRKAEHRKMKRIIHTIVVITALAGAAALQAQTADEIVDKHIAALGGKDAISKVKSLVTESSISLMGGENPATTTIVDGVGYKSEMDFNGSKIVQCVTEKGGWMINPMAGASDPTPMPDDQYKAQKGSMFVGGALYDYAARGSKVEFMGKNGDAYKLKLTTKDNVEYLYEIDGTTYLLKSMVTKGDMQGQQVDITTTLSDYRKTDAGFMVPYALDINIGAQFEFTVAVKKVQLNPAIDPSIFEMPKAPPAAVPAAAPKS